MLRLDDAGSDADVTVESREARKAGHTLADTLYVVRGWGLMTSGPRHFSRLLRATLRD